jgi:prephenate dehydrogenase
MSGAHDAGRSDLTIGIAGLGLIGGSIALGLRARWPGVRVTGLDHPDVLRLAETRRVIDRQARSLADFVACDLVVLAAPVPAIVELIRETGRAGLRGVVTDVGSTKRHIMAAATTAGLSAFVGGHPMAGAEQGGLTNASPDLFIGRPWLIVAGDRENDEAIALVERTAGALGAEPCRIDASAHDRTMAYLSHLPQLVAGALMSAAGDACGGSGLALAGRAFHEMTRVAASPSDVWRGILASNADYVGEAVRAFLSRLPGERALADGAHTDQLFAEAQRWRQALAAAAPRHDG